MTERRTTITRIWRPVGEPARRVEDFAEIPHLTVWPAQAAPAANQPDRREIGARLENWARWATECERDIGSSPTARMIDRAKREAGIVEDRTGERRDVDDHDALRLEQAMRHLTTQHRMLLWWCYIRQAQPEVVCRKMSIAHRPATLFVDLFRQAQAAVESSLDKSKGKA
jgi:hypothetical protein